MDMLMMDWLGKPVWVWVGFLTFVLGLTFIDLFVMHREHRVISMKESILTTSFYAALAVLFSFWVGWEFGHDAGVNFLTGYAVEFSLSMDNVFVMAMIIAAFKIPRKYQYDVLVWGILAAIVLRGIMIIFGAALVHQYAWILYVFGAFLLVSGLKMLWFKDHAESDIKHNWMFRLLYRYGRVTDTFHGDKFWVRLVDKNTSHYTWYMTPLMAALVVINLADIVFAVDSVPAIFAITTDPYIVFTSNIFAILGLRSLYFTLSAMMERFQYLTTSLALILVFIGSKILLHDIAKGILIPEVTLGITVAILAGGVLYSLWKTRGQS